MLDPVGDYARGVSWPRGVWPPSDRKIGLAVSPIN